MTSRKRVSLRQMELLVEYLEGHRDLARGRLRSREGSALTSRLWAECANILNAEGDGNQRTPKEWSKWYTDYKCRLLNRIKQIRHNQRGTGGGPGVPTSISPLDERIAALLDAGTEAVGRSGTPQNVVQINPLLPAPHAVSPLPALPDNLPVPIPSFAELLSDGIEPAPIPNNSINIIDEDNIIVDGTPAMTQDITHFTESAQEASAARQCRRNNPRRRGQLDLPINPCLAAYCFGQEYSVSPYAHPPQQLYAVHAFSPLAHALDVSVGVLANVPCLLYCAILHRHSLFGLQKQDHSEACVQLTNTCNKDI